MVETKQRTTKKCTPSCEHYKFNPHLPYSTCSKDSSIKAFGFKPECQVPEEQEKFAKWLTEKVSV